MYKTLKFNYLKELIIYFKKYEDVEKKNSKSVFIYIYLFYFILLQITFCYIKL